MIMEGDSGVCRTVGVWWLEGCRVEGGSGSAVGKIIFGGGGVIVGSKYILL